LAEFQEATKGDGKLEKELGAMDIDKRLEHYKKLRQELIEQLEHKKESGKQQKMEEVQRNIKELEQARWTHKQKDADRRRQMAEDNKDFLAGLEGISIEDM